MNVLTVKRRDKALVEFSNDGVGGAVALVLNRLHLLDPHVEIAGIFQNVPEKLRALGEIAGEFGEKLEKLGIVGNQTHQYLLQNRSRQKKRTGLIAPSRHEGLCNGFYENHIVYPMPRRHEWRPMQRVARRLSPSRTAVRS